jgi:hypothetical protein
MTYRASSIALAFVAFSTTAVGQDTDRFCSENAIVWFLSGLVLEKAACDETRPQSRPQREQVMAEVRAEHLSCFQYAEASPEFSATTKRYAAAVSEQIQKNPMDCDRWTTKEVSKLIADMKELAAPAR